MAAPVHKTGLDALTAAVAERRVDTVRVCFSDHYGVLRGRRLAAESFLDDVSAPQAFCDGALVWDVRCEIFEATDFSNFRTGYPDLHARPDLDTLRPCGWRDGEYAVLADPHDAHGAPIEVDPRRILRRVIEHAPAAAEVASRLELRVPDRTITAAWAAGHAHEFAAELARGLQASGLPLLAVEWSRPERILRLTLGPSAPLDAADALVLTRTAARELALAHGVRLTAMPRLATGNRMAAMELDVEIPAGAALDEASRRLEDVALLLRPLPTAYGPEPAPVAREARGRWSALASSDACPYLAIAAAVAAGHEEQTAQGDAPEPAYPQAVAAFRAAGWTGSWFHPAFIHDALELADREAALRESAITDWDLERYWEAG
jgi:glutamine synthetase